VAKAEAPARDGTAVVEEAGHAAEGEGERRKLIAAAAARCFEKWGVGRTRMEDIAREVGMARPVLYRYYASKDALVLEVMVHHINERAADLHRRMKPRGPAGPLIVEALRTGISGGDDRALTQSMLEENALRTTARLVAESDDVFHAMSAYWKPYLEYARERGELRPEVDVDQAVRWLTFLVMHFLTVPETVPPLDELPVYLQTFVVNAIVA
jgi:AcrR family transcriptional regulator